ncbi:hypothetical protein Pan54_47860 [Rubinisphaera italica]|uniref:Uncharacterized protein n=1 Tax=Rubinisphaera italica TaxID=2527969 RepID=A0A5C5XLD1_9PLAN|nr:hypothetical protein Pan54_47860 [Rubinisphaera italica]
MRTPILKGRIQQKVPHLQVLTVAEIRFQWYPFSSDVVYSVWYGDSFCQEHSPLPTGLESGDILFVEHGDADHRCRL